MKQIEEEVLAEEARGSNIRYWEDVGVGENLKPILKGPLGMTDEIAYLIGGGAPIARLAAHGVMLRNYQTHPAWAYRDPDTGALEPIFLSTITRPLRLLKVDFLYRTTSDFRDIHGKCIY